MKGLPLEFGIDVRGPECFYDGAIRGSKKFSDKFSRFDTIPAVTDSQPPSHPASHVAVAITLNAKASSLKTSDGATGRRKKFDDIFSRVNRIHQRDRRTDTGRQQRPRLRIALSGKNR